MPKYKRNVQMLLIEKNCLNSYPFLATAYWPHLRMCPSGHVTTGTAEVCWCIRGYLKMLHATIKYVIYLRHLQFNK